MIPKPVFLNTAFENGSPLLWDVDEHSVTIQSLHDHEKGSSNRQGSHWHFEIHGQVGQKIQIKFLPLVSIYGGKPGHFLKKGFTSVISADGNNWKSFVFDFHPDFTISAEIILESPVIRLALIQPYGFEDLHRFFNKIQKSPLVKIETMTLTPEGRPVELITVSKGMAKRSVLIRARAHPWETAGNFFVEGLVRGLLNSPRGSALLDLVTFYLIPMANKDGVARGYSRFTPTGLDLNRHFVPGFDFAAAGAPENAALVAWLDKQKAQGCLPCFALDLHNDQEGNLHLNDDPAGEHLGRMKRFEECLRRHTPFREGSKGGNVKGTFGEGLHSQYGIDAAILEFNAHWLKGCGCVPLGEHWVRYGAETVGALLEYFSTTK